MVLLLSAAVENPSYARSNTSLDVDEILDISQLMIRKKNILTGIYDKVYYYTVVLIPGMHVPGARYKRNSKCPRKKLRKSARMDRRHTRYI